MQLLRVWQYKEFYYMIDKTYQPSSFERRLYKQWMERGYFTPSVHSDAPPFSMVTPPPNITGQLHLGHGLDNAIQDTLGKTLCQVYARSPERKSAIKMDVGGLFGSVYIKKGNEK